MRIKYEKNTKEYQYLIGFWIFVFIVFGYILWLNRLNPKNLDIFGLILNLLGAGFIAIYPILGDILETNSNLMREITFLEWDGTGDFNRFERQMIIIGLCLLIVGFCVQVYASILNQN